MIMNVISTIIDNITDPSTSVTYCAKTPIVKIWRPAIWVNGTKEVSGYINMNNRQSSLVHFKSIMQSTSILNYGSSRTLVYATDGRCTIFFRTRHRYINSVDLSVAARP